MRHPARLAGTSLLRMQSDERLAELAGSGHESAFAAIVDRYRTPLLRYCTGIVGPSRAEDAVQQALINAHDALQRTDDVRNLRSWLYRIAHNASLNVLRAVRDDVPLDEHELAASRGGGAGAPGPAESFEQSERFRSTLAALQALPERQRAALVLRELEGRSHEEIAAALGVTKGSARQHLMRARVAVRTAVTAVTPYPLVARLAEWASAGAAGGSGWVDAAATAGAGASLAKLTAGLAATGALVGGAAVGTEHVVHRGSGGAAAGAAALPRAAERSAERVVKGASEVVVAVPAAAVTPKASAAAPRAGGAGAKQPSSSRSPGRERRSAPREESAEAKVKAPAVSLPAAPVAPMASHRGRDDSGSKDKGRSKHEHDAASRHGRQEKDDQRGASGHGKKDKRSGSSAPASSQRSGGDEDTSKGRSGKSGSGSGSGSGSNESSGRGSGSGSSTSTTGDSSGSGSKTSSETTPTTTTTESPTTTTTTSTTSTSPVDPDDED